MNEDDPLLKGQETLQRVEDLISKVDEIVDRWPRYHKNKYALDMYRHLTHMEELCVAANLRYFKKSTLQDLDISNKQLQLLIRRVGREKFTDKKGKERMLVTDGFREDLDRRTAEIGRLIGGWLKATKEKN